MVKHILVADDERSNALMLARLLEKEGYHVMTAGNGVEALKIKACLEAGASKYIGRFNRVTFLEQLKEFGV